MKNIKPGFSLVELLISLITISLIVAVFTPIMTRKLKNDRIALKSGNAQKGLQIYTNPGSYAFDVPMGVSKIYISGAGGGGGGAGALSVSKNETFNESTSGDGWVVPLGVYSVTFTITGAGGGGGAANGTKNEDIYNDNLVENLYPNSCLSGEYLVTRGTQNNTDLCMVAKNLSLADAAEDSRLYIVNTVLSSENPDENPTCDALNQKCCYVGRTATPDSSSKNRTVCNFNAAEYICRTYKTKEQYSISHMTNYYRMPNKYELEVVSKYMYPFENDSVSNSYFTKLNLCTHDDPNTAAGGKLRAEENGVERCRSQGNRCRTSADDSYCYPCRIIGSDSELWSQSVDQTVVRPYLASGSMNFTGSVRCVRELIRYKVRTSGAGGSSGAQLTKTIAVLPNDVLKITIGAGGEGGIYNVKKNNGKENAYGSGAQGGVTKISHYRSNALKGEYYVKGGFGGPGASSVSNGKPLLNADINKNLCYDSNSGFISCSTRSYQGLEGNDEKGGRGGIVGNDKTIQIEDGEPSSGGYSFVDNSRKVMDYRTEYERSKAKGQSGSNNSGFGGGGGLTPPWVRYTSDFYSGGRGGSGKVEISYNKVLPGGGGGAGASAGLDAGGSNQEIEYSVAPGTRLVLVVGAGGPGGATGEPGRNGVDSTLMEDHIIFGAGSGGSIGQISSLLPGAGGLGGILKIKSGMSSKIKVLNPAVSSNIGKGRDGSSGALKATGSYSNYLSYGFDGGIGGTTYLGYFGGCGGGVRQDVDSTRACDTSSKRDGADASYHNVVKNAHGGAGGGGGGVAVSDVELGEGGSGSDGFIRIRWGN